MSRASAFHQRDVEKALKAAKRQGGGAVVVDLNKGTIRIELSAPVSVLPATSLDAWRAKHKGGQA